MSTGLFGPRGPSYPYYSTRYSNPISPYPIPTMYQTHSVYPHSYLSPVNSQYPNLGLFHNPLDPYGSYSWNNPKISLPAKNLESILIAILILVVLDQVFVRPLKKTH